MSSPPIHDSGNIRATRSTAESSTDADDTDFVDKLAFVKGSLAADILGLTQQEALQIVMPHVSNYAHIFNLLMWNVASLPEPVLKLVKFYAQATNTNINQRHINISFADDHRVSHCSLTDNTGVLRHTLVALNAMTPQDTIGNIFKNEPGVDVESAKQLLKLLGVDVDALKPPTKASLKQLTALNAYGPADALEHTLELLQSIDDDSHGLIAVCQQAKDSLAFINKLRDESNNAWQEATVGHIADVMEENDVLLFSCGRAARVDDGGHSGHAIYIVVRVADDKKNVSCHVVNYGKWSNLSGSAPDQRSSEDFRFVHTSVCPLNERFKEWLAQCLCERHFGAPMVADDANKRVALFYRPPDATVVIHDEGKTWSYNVHQRAGNCTVFNLMNAIRVAGQLEGREWLSLKVEMMLKLGQRVLCELEAAETTSSTSFYTGQRVGEFGPSIRDVADLSTDDVANSALSSLESAPTVDNDGDVRLLSSCEHYPRQYTIQCSLCQKFTACRLCHETEESSHLLNRAACRVIMCSCCNQQYNIDEVEDSKCPHCSQKLAPFFCNKCAYGGDAENISHCDACGICRVGNNLIHCNDCGRCWASEGTESVRDSHVCSNKHERHCFVCLFPLDHVRDSVVPCPVCGNCAHVRCLSRADLCDRCRTLTHLGSMRAETDRLIRCDALEMTCVCVTCGHRSQLPWTLIPKCPTSDCESVLVCQSVRKTSEKVTFVRDSVNDNDVDDESDDNE